MLARSRPVPFFETPADAPAVEAAEAAVERAEAKVEADPTPENKAALADAEARLKRVEETQAKHSTDIAELRTAVDSRAAVDHDHPAAPPKAPEPDSTPKREPWWMRKIGGSR